MAGSEMHYSLARPVLENPLKLLLVVAPYYKDIAEIDFFACQIQKYKNKKVK